MEKYKLNNLQLNGNQLKLIAVLTMTVDHIGAYLLTDVVVLRIIGRVAFPIFAFFIAEGCKYTKNKRKYLLNLFVFASVTQIIKIAFGHNNNLNILFTFLAAAVMIFLFSGATESINEHNTVKTVLCYTAFAFVVILIYMLTQKVIFQYDFWGCITPLLVYMAEFSDKYGKELLYSKLLMLFAALTAVYLYYGGVQIWAYISVFLLLLYNDKKGNRVNKYFFYTFYPLHLAVIFIFKILMQ